MNGTTNIRNDYRKWVPHHDIPPFYHPAWLDLIAGEHNWDIALTRGEGGDVSGLWAFSISRRFGFKALLNPRLTSYFGPLILSSGNANTIYRQLYGQLPSFSFMEQKLHLSNTETGGLARLGFKLIGTPTYMLPLGQDESNLLKGFKGNTRRVAKKGTRELALTYGHHAALSRLIHKNLKKALGRQLPAEHTLTRLFQLIEKKQWGRVFIAQKNDELLGGVVIIKNKGDAVYLIGSQSEHGKRLGAVTFLIWRSIQWAKSQGFQRFDFEGSSIPGIARFFKSFGAVEHRVTTIRKIKSPLLQAYFAIKGH